MKWNQFLLIEKGYYIVSLSMNIESFFGTSRFLKLIWLSFIQRISWFISGFAVTQKMSISLTIQFGRVIANA